jgi:hypothetical protein
VIPHLRRGPALGCTLAWKLLTSREPGSDPWIARAAGARRGPGFFGFGGGRHRDVVGAAWLEGAADYGVTFSPLNDASRKPDSEHESNSQLR